VLREGVHRHEEGLIARWRDEPGLAMSVLTRFEQLYDGSKRNRKHVLPFGRTDDDRRVLAQTSRFPAWFFGFVIAVVVSVILINQFLYDIRPGNSRVECTNGCKNSSSPNACQKFCDCIYDAGNPLNVCLDEYQSAKRSTP
jgi:hypothetical protein